MPFSCAASSASAICRAMRERLVERDRAARNRSASVISVDELHHQRGDAGRLVRARRSRRCSDDSATRASWPHARICARRSASCANGVGQHLDGDLAVQPRIRGSIDLAHASGSDSGGDFVGTKTIAWGERHVRELSSVLEEKGRSERTGPDKRCQRAAQAGLYRPGGHLTPASGLAPGRPPLRSSTCSC